MPAESDPRFAEVPRDPFPALRDSHILRIADDGNDVRADLHASEPSPFQFVDLAGGDTGVRGSRHIDGRFDSGRLSIELGRVRLPRERLASLDSGDVVAMEQDAQHPVSILLNGIAIARGHLVTIDGRIAVRVIERIEENIPGATGGARRAA